VKKLRSRWNWKILLMSLVANMTAILITAFLLPGITILDRRLVFLALLAVVLGLLNTFIKPILQVLTIRLMFFTYGLILIVTNTIILLLLNWIFANFTINGLLSAVFGAILISLIGAFLDYLLGVTPPIGYQQAVQEQEAAHEGAN
jgi:putative membrane protein